MCRLLRSAVQKEQEASHRRYPTDFDEKVVSAVGEAFNNVAIHAYRGLTPGTARLEFRVEGDRLTIRLFDTGKGFNLAAEIARSLDTLRESQMGIVIMRQCMDEVSYKRGDPPSPNVLTMTKRYLVADSAEVLPNEAGS